MTLTPQSDLLWWLPALQVYLGVLLTGVAGWPWWTRVWQGREDKGAGLWLAGGIFTYVLAMQVLWRTGLLELHFVWAMLVWVSIGISGYGLLPRIEVSTETKTRIRSSGMQALMVFTLLFWFWAFVRSADPGVTHTEQPMDTMWMRSAMASDSPPISDSWFGGEPATYYAEGHQALAFVAHAFGTPPAIAINTGQLLWFALTGLLAFQAGTLLTQPTKQGMHWAGGALSLLFLLFVSTPPGFIDALTQKDFWWWWDASRVLQDGGTSLITEFPFFSYYLGDMHAHVLGVPVLLLSLIASHQLSQTDRFRFLHLLPITLCIAWSWKMNPWQTPTCIALPFLALIVRGKKLTTAEVNSIALALWPTVFLFWPRLAPGPTKTLGLNSVHHVSPIEWSLVFGFLLPGVVWSLFRPRNRFLNALVVLVVGMWAVCEVFFLQDVFQNRMNTVFKVYYQVWIILAVVSAYGWMMLLRKKPFQRAARVGLVLCLTPGLLYAARLSLSGFTHDSKSLHAWTALPTSQQTLLSLADHFIEPGDRIVEAPGNSYQADTSVLGTWTSGHTLLGWTGHQQQWRPGESFPDPTLVYRAQSEADLDNLIITLKPDWVYVGKREREVVEFHPQWLTWMDQRADRLIQDSTQTLFRIR